MIPFGDGLKVHGTGPDAVGFVLAGGQSSRMGEDKAMLLFAGQPLVVHALSILQEAGLSASIAGAHPSARRGLEVFAPVIEDPEPGLGPLAGICAALASTLATHAVFLPVDLPFLPPSLLIFMLQRARMTDRAVMIPSVSGFDQTFPVVLARNSLPTLQSELAARRCGCFSAFQAVAAHRLQPVSRVVVEFASQTGLVAHRHGLTTFQWFLNLNSPADLNRAKALSARRIA